MADVVIIVVSILIGLMVLALSYYFLSPSIRRRSRNSGLHYVDSEYIDNNFAHNETAHSDNSNFYPEQCKHLNNIRECDACISYYANRDDDVRSTWLDNTRDKCDYAKELRERGK